MTLAPQEPVPQPTILGQPTTFTSAQVDLIKRTICKDATDDELKLFLYVSQRSGLDPLSRQIHAIKRWDAQQQRNVMAIQTGIDGYRLIADRTGQYAGNSAPTFGEYTETDSTEELVPEWAEVTITKVVAGEDRQFTARAYYDEYVQTKKDGKPTSMWAKMPHGQLAKCAETLALRKAFPNDLSGLYTHEEMQQADTPADPTPSIVEPSGAVTEPTTSPEPPPAEAPPEEEPIDETSPYFRYLKKCAELKEKLGNQVYYKIMGIHGLEHSNEVSRADTKAMTAIVTALMMEDAQ